MMYFIFSKKQCIAVLSAICILCAAGCAAVIAAKETAVQPRHLRVVVDAGHGLPDGGAVGTLGTVEQEVNLAIAKKLQEILTAKGAEVIMTREDENGLWTKKSTTIRQMKVEDMRKRLEIMQKSHADIFVTIHMNSFPNSSASGLRIFYSAQFPEIKDLAENIQSRMSDVTGAHTHTVQTADTKLFLMKNPPIPVILAECGFLSNPEEESKLNSEEYRAKLAWALADAIEKYYAM